MRCFFNRVKRDSFSLITPFYSRNAIQNEVEHPLDWIYDWVDDVATDNKVNAICRIVYPVPEFYDFFHVNVFFLLFDAAKLRIFGN